MRQTDKDKGSMDANHAPDNHIHSWGTFHVDTALDRAVLIVRAQVQEQQQQEQQQEQMLPARRSLEVGSS